MQQHSTHDSSSAKEWSARVDACLLCDQRGFAKRLADLQRRARRGDSVETSFVTLEKQIQTSAERRLARQARIPTNINFPASLPICQQRDVIAAAIMQHQVVVIAGETGSGKTTQLPKICLTLGRGVAGMIGCTQPRRIAAKTLSARMAKELNVPLGELVGYKIRFSDRINPDSAIKVMTDGILLAEIQSDPLLTAYDTLIIDEAHERSLNIDFLLGYLKLLLPQRQDLKVIIASATIDTERFAQHFSAPAIEVSGRTYPVEVRYRPLNGEDIDALDQSLPDAICSAVDELFSSTREGDVLVFLSGEREIHETAEALRKHHPPHVEILPLYSRLSGAEQDRVFEPSGKRRIILATNVAETSLTVPGVRYVIDTGYARISRYSTKGRLQRLPIEKISRASADQRKGRCGRTSDGICLRLYTEEDYLVRPQFTDPEILRTNLASVILRMKMLHLGNIDEFPFLQAPSPQYIRDGYRTLSELGALDKQQELTETGRNLAKFPVDPRVARMILAAREWNCLHEMLIIASALNVQDPRERPAEQRAAADQAHRVYNDENSDFLALLKLWQAFHTQAAQVSKNKLRTYCRENFLSYVRLRDWQDIHRQLLSLVNEMGARVNETPADYAQIHHALLSGLLGFVATKKAKHEFIGTHHTKLEVFPGSVLFKRPPTWIMAAEWVETAKRYARVVAKIEPQWIETVGGHLCRKNYSEPHWEKRRGDVVANERVTLFGLVVVPQRSVQFGPIDPIQAREIFIRSALVDGDYVTKAPFFEHNQRLMSNALDLEARTRRPDIVVDPETIYAFYDGLIAQGIYSHQLFESWRRGAEQENKQLLFLTAEQLRRDSGEIDARAQFPDHVDIGSTSIQLDYHFEPGHEADGVTAIIPVHLVNQLTPFRFEWLVPGLLREKILFLIKSLPGSVRRAFVPVPTFADACFAALRPLDDSLLSALAAFLSKMTGVSVPQDAWRPQNLPAHLLMRFKIIDARGAVLAAGRDFAVLQDQWKATATAQFSSLVQTKVEQTGLTGWTCGDIPDVQRITHSGLDVAVYPALEDQGQSVALVGFDSSDQARLAHRGGVRRLFLIQMPASKWKYLEKNLPHLQQAGLYFLTYGPSDALKEDFFMAVADRALGGDPAVIRKAEEFAQKMEQANQQFFPLAIELSRLLERVMAEYRTVMQQLDNSTLSTNKAALADVRSQLSQLIYPGFLTQTPNAWLQHYPRYLKAVDLRLKKLATAALRDQAGLSQIAPFWASYINGPANAKHHDAWQDYRWLIEEFRVSLFAQELKTVMPVSAKRLQKQLELLAHQK